MKEHKFPYEWTLKDANFTKDKGTVFSCFACGGGSTMGYKLAGFDVLGCNEIDPKMIEAYKVNHNPKYAYLEPIQTFKTRKDLPEELYNLDILDGSPPCSSFSMAGNREKDWGKEKKFREGQADQVLDTLFFDFIDLAKELQPKVVVAENVSGMMMGEAKEYVKKVYTEFQNAGYQLRIEPYLLDASTMGVPQRRRRVFFVALRNDLAGQFMEQVDMFQSAPKLDLEFNDKIVPYKEIQDHTDKSVLSHLAVSKLWDLCAAGESFSTVHPKGSFFNGSKAHPDKVVPTITAQPGGTRGVWSHTTKRPLNDLEIKKAGTYPMDYIFNDCPVVYLVGMSVPPVMTAQVASRIHEQWLSKL
ncbi:MAG: DNA (cytosine-5)-methyltransferase 1 [Enterobacterales bacterium]|jgi:DNA (cytosine-5)-methyltransferase 1